MTPPYLARETPFSPYADAILSLWTAHLHDMTPESAAYKMQHWYQENPAGSGACVVLQTSGQDRPVGVQCLLERRHWSGAEAAKVAGLAEFAIDPAHRSLGPALTLLKKCLEIGRGRYSLVYGMPNSKSFSVCKRAGLVHVGDMTRFILPLRLGLLLRRRRARWLRALKWPADLALRVAAALRAAWRRAPSQWRDAEFDDPDIDALWGLRPAYLVLSERGKRALDWRFNLATGWKLAIAYGRSGIPFGYVVWRLEDDFVRIGDFLCADPDRQTAALLSGFVHHVRRERGANGVELEFCGRSNVQRGIQGAGFVARSAMCPLVLDRSPDDGQGPANRLYFTTFDRVSD